jgi:hypothetical protein
MEQVVRRESQLEVWVMKYLSNKICSHFYLQLSAAMMKMCGETHSLHSKLPATKSLIAMAHNEPPITT